MSKHLRHVLIHDDGGNQVYVESRKQNAMIIIMIATDVLFRHLASGSWHLVTYTPVYQDDMLDIIT